jgi:diguanylate cyclase (GGDEF)-like protein
MTPMSEIVRMPATRRRGEAVLLVSFRHREALSHDVTKLGRRVIAVRRRTGLEQRLASSGASYVIIDLRDAFEEGLEALSALSALAENDHVPVLALYDRKTQVELDRVVAAGATLLLGAPWRDSELSSTLELAGRQCRQNAGVRLRHTPGLPRDVLTGLADAASFAAWLTEKLAGEATSLLLISIAKMELVNAAYGHELGDAALRAIAHRIEPLVNEMPGSDHLLARLRGTDFAIALAGDVGDDRLLLLAEAIVDAVARPLALSKEIVRLGCRVGVVKATQRERNPARLMKRARTAIAEAKARDAGPICFLVGTEAITADRSEQLQQDLRRALHRQEIDILFQPQIGIGSSRIEGVEALARWRHPIYGEIGAATLFAVAEQSDYIVELSTHVQARAIAIAADWPENLASVRLSVNVTAADMARPRFASQFLAMVDKAGFPRSRLTVEVTESGLMSDLDAAAATLNALRAGGCRVAIDDFGTGYSSLAYLNALPADYLKIDKGLADDISGDERSRLVVRSVITLAKSLGLSVIAEGVESEAQLALLAREGCALYQGFLRARPLETTALIEMVAAERA